MTLAETKALLPTLDALAFKLENGMPVPAHFHLTEIGVVDKRFVDCGVPCVRKKKSVCSCGPPMTPTTVSTP